MSDDGCGIVLDNLSRCGRPSVGRFHGDIVDGTPVTFDLCQRHADEFSYPRVQWEAEPIPHHGPGASVDVDSDNTLIVWAPGGEKDRSGWKACWSTVSRNPERGTFVEADDADGVLALLEDRLPIDEEDGYGPALHAITEYVNEHLT